MIHVFFRYWRQEFSTEIESGFCLAFHGSEILPEAAFLWWRLTDKTVPNLFTYYLVNDCNFESFFLVSSLSHRGWLTSDSLSNNLSADGSSIHTSYAWLRNPGGGMLFPDGWSVSSINRAIETWNLSVILYVRWARWQLLNLPLGKANSAKMHRKELSILKHVKRKNLRNCGYPGKQRPSAKQQNLIWSWHMTTNTAFSKPEHRRMSEWRTCETTKVTCVRHFLDLLNVRNY